MFRLLRKMKKLTVQRLDTANYFRKVQFYCDDVRLGSLGFAQRMEFDIPPNARYVYAKIDWCKSEPLKLHFGENEETILMECSSSVRNIFVDTSKYLKLHSIQHSQLPSTEELEAFKVNFRKVAGISTFMILLFGAFLVYTIYVAIAENSPIWYALTALAGFNMYRLSQGMRKRMKGQV